NKHHLTNNYLVYLKQSLMDLCTRENLHQVDLLAKAERKVTEKEYLMGMIENNSHVENTGKDQTVQKEILSTENNIAPERPAYQQETPDGTNMPAAIFEKSGLRLVTDLQHCIKAQQSKAYANKVKLSNLQNMARTLAYVQEHSPELALYEAAV
ncbi:MAG TPA: hypothetical protein DCZ40_11745, partial [Lachnospiraceae bacterium]|nr:hypothetical protein [Lachnospiraceae bacterium]